MELVQDIVIGSLGGLAVRQIKKMVFGPATDPNAAHQQAMAERIERLEALLADSNQAQQQQQLTPPPLQVDYSDPVEGSKKRRSPEPSARPDTSKRPRLASAGPSVPSRSADDSISSDSSSLSHSNANSDSSSDSSSSSSSDDSSDSESKQDGMERPSAAEKSLAWRMAAMEAQRSFESRQESENLEEGPARDESALQNPSKAKPTASQAALPGGSSSSSGSESEGSQEQEGGEPISTLPALQMPFRGTDNSALEAAEEEGVEVRRLEGAGTEAAPLPTSHASPAVPILGSVAGGATVEAADSLAAAPFALQDGVPASQEAYMAALQPADTAPAEAESAPLRSASPGKEGSFPARLRAVPAIKKKKPASGITSRLGSWVGALNPFRRGTVTVAQEGPTEAPSAAVPAPEPVLPPPASAPEEMMEISPVQEEPAHHAQPTTPKASCSPSPDPLALAEHQTEEVVTPEEDVVQVLEAIAARGGSPPWNVAPTGEPAGEPGNDQMADDIVKEFNNHNGSPAQGEAAQGEPTQGATGHNTRRYFPKLSQILMERAEAGVAEVTATARAAARERVLPPSRVLARQGGLVGGPSWTPALGQQARFSPTGAAANRGLPYRSRWTWPTPSASPSPSRRSALPRRSSPQPTPSVEGTPGLKSHSVSSDSEDSLSEGSDEPGDDPPWQAVPPRRWIAVPKPDMPNPHLDTHGGWLDEYLEPAEASARLPHSPAPTEMPPPIEVLTPSEPHTEHSSDVSPGRQRTSSPEGLIPLNRFYALESFCLATTEQPERSPAPTELESLSLSPPPSPGQSSPSLGHGESESQPGIPVTRNVAAIIASMEAAPHRRTSSDYSPTSPSYSPQYSPDRGYEAMSEPPSPKRLGLEGSSDDEEVPRWARRSSRGRSTTRRPLATFRVTSPSPAPTERPCQDHPTHRPTCPPPSGSRTYQRDYTGWRIQHRAPMSRTPSERDNNSSDDTSSNSEDSDKGSEMSLHSPSVSVELPQPPTFALRYGVTFPTGRTASPSPISPRRHRWTATPTARSTSPVQPSHVRQTSSPHSESDNESPDTSRRTPRCRHRRTATPTARSASPVQRSYSRRTPSPQPKSNSKSPQASRRTPLLSGMGGGGRRSRSRSVRGRGGVLPRGLSPSVRERGGFHPRGLSPPQGTSRSAHAGDSTASPRAPMASDEAGRGGGFTQIGQWFDRLHPIIAAQSYQLQMGLSSELSEGPTGADMDTSPQSLLQDAMHIGHALAADLDGMMAQDDAEAGADLGQRKSTSTTLELTSSEEEDEAEEDEEDDDVGTPPLPERANFPNRSGGRDRAHSIDYFPGREQSPGAGPSPSPRGGGKWNRRKPFKFHHRQHAGRVVKHAKRVAKMGLLLAGQFMDNLSGQVGGDAPPTAARASTSGGSGSGDGEGSSGGSPGVEFVAEGPQIPPYSPTCPGPLSASHWESLALQRAGRQAIAATLAAGKTWATGVFANGEEEEEEDIVDLT